MASTAAEEGGRASTARSPSVNFFGADFALRLFVLVSSVAALAVELTAKQTEPVAVNPLTQLPVYRHASYKHSPALLYLVSALATSCFYTVVTLAVSAAAIKKSTDLLFGLAVLDLVMLGVMASATGAGGAVAYVGLRGNSHVNWNDICNVYGKFCRHVGSSLALSLAASVALLLLLLVSLLTLRRRSRI